MYRIPDHLGLAAPGGNPDRLQTQGEAETIHLSYSIFFPPTHVQCIAATNWAHEIEKRTDGRVKSPFYPPAPSARRTYATKA
jgi:TRAP-type C4-dicarboxylate transport system substrate-binding protein